MSRRKKKKQLPPRAKRMNRSGRLQSAPHWLAKYTGQNIVRGYRKHYGVNWECALIELEMLGVKIDPVHKSQLLETVRQNAIHKARKKEERKAKANEFFDYDQDDTFAYIAGYTPAGFAFGITWKEWEEIERADAAQQSRPQVYIPHDNEENDPYRRDDLELLHTLDNLESPHDSQPTLPFPDDLDEISF